MLARTNRWALPFLRWYAFLMIRPLLRHFKQRQSRRRSGQQSPRISIIIPCFNQARFLPEAVASVISQTYTKWECIIVNDGSTDNTSDVARELIARYAAQDIWLLEKPNGGLADARNAGIEAACGEYILPLDADDRIHPTMLEKTLQTLLAHPEFSFIYTDAIRFGEVNNQYQTEEYDLRRLCEACIPNYCALYPRRVWISYHTGMIWGYEDWDFWLRCAEQGYYGKRLPEHLFYYRIRTGSMLSEARAHDQELKAKLVNNHPKLYQKMTRKWAKQTMRALNNTRHEIPTN